MNTEDGKVDGDTFKEDVFTEEDPLKEKGTIERNKDFKGKITEALTGITVEPCLMLFVLAFIMTMITTTNLHLEKACRVNLNFTTEICDALKARKTEGLKEYEMAVQKLTVFAISTKTIITATIPCFLGLLVGSWSDKTGRRKFFLAYPIFGLALLCVNAMINVYFFHELRLEVVVFSEAIIEALTGSWCVIILNVFSYISDITNNENRTFRMGIANFCLTVSFPIGLGLGGVILKNYGYYACYGAAAVIHIINILYTIIWLKDPKRTSEQISHDNRGVRHFLKTFFDLSNLKETIMTIVRNGRRTHLLLAIVCLLFGTFFGENSTMYLLTRYRFNWDEVKFSLFQSYNFVTHTVGTIFSIMVFSKYLKWHDAMLGIISTVSKIISSLVYCFATSERIFFLGPLIEILNGTSLLATRSLLSKLVKPDEYGKMNSIISITENIMPLIFVPLYTSVYSATMDVLPGFVFLMGATLLFPATGYFSWLFYDHRRILRKQARQESKNSITITS